MEILRNLITRLRRAGILLLAGLLLIIYIAFGFLYMQQGGQQTELEKQIVGLNAIVSGRLPSTEQLEADYEETNLALAPLADKDALDRIVGIAEKSGIDVDPAAGNFSIPPASYSEAKVGGGTYQLLSFQGIKVQGDNASVMAFISDLDSGETLETMVLTNLDINQIEVTDEDGETRTETEATVTVAIYTKSQE